MPESKFAVSIIDYGINNLKSISKAFEKIGRTSKIVDSPGEILSARCLVLPGVGAFGDGMAVLREKKLVKPIKEKVGEGTLLLGICLGMQMLFTESEEFGLHKGLDLIKGRVVRFRQPSDVGIKGYVVPHVGWNEIRPPKNASAWKDTLLADSKPSSNFYFVHSFHPVVENPENVLAVTEYGKQEFCSVARKGSVCGTQFHPEKSGPAGLKILKKFCELNNV